jgi:hypothetical protein
MPVLTPAAAPARRSAGATVLRAVAAATPVAALTLIAAGPAAASSSQAQLSVLHGVPGVTVDVYVDGERTLDDFAPGDLAGPLPLPAGSYSVAITASDAADDSSPVIGPVDLSLEAGGNYTAVAYLGTDGEPTAGLFPNDVSATAAGEGRVTVRHVANAPEVTISADGSDLGNIANAQGQQEISTDVPADTYAVAVTPASGGDAVFETDLAVQEGVSTIVYAWGDITASPSTFAVATQTIDGLHSAPSGVPAGEAGLAGTSSSTWLAALAGVGVVGAVVAARRLTAPAAPRR